MKLALSATIFLLALVGVGFAQVEVPDLVGEWRVVRKDASVPCPNCSPAQNWIRALPGAVFDLTESVIPPMAMARKDVPNYLYNPSQPSITISDGTHVLGFLQRQSGRRYEGEFASGGCWIHLSLEESEDGSMLSGTSRLNTKISTRACLRNMTKDAKRGAPFDYALSRLR